MNCERLQCLHHMIVEMPRRDQASADQHSCGGLPAGASGGLQDGDCPRPEVGFAKINVKSNVKFL